MAGSDKKANRKSFLQGDDLPLDDSIASSGDEPWSEAAAFADYDDAAADAAAAGTPFISEPARLDFPEDDRLPWLESADDIDDAGDVDKGRVIAMLVLGLVTLAMVVGGVWIATHRGGFDRQADGSLIRAEAGPYKVRPSDPGGKTFAGTGDSSFEVSEGKTRGAKLAGSDAPSPATPVDNRPGFAATQEGTPTPGQAAGGVGVQVGAYMNNAAAEAGWATISGLNPVLSSVRHRVVEGRADIGNVYRLQAVAADLAAANALCAQLKANGQDCQVKR
jgi:hypothetical protein